ncbi:hypothetical protein AVEN_131450-1, partial [Araneus ventricosus]
MVVALFISMCLRIKCEFDTIKTFDSFWYSLVYLHSPFEATRWLLWDEHRNFELRSHDEDGILAGMSSPTFLTTPAGRSLAT